MVNCDEEHFRLLLDDGKPRSPVDDAETELLVEVRAHSSIRRVHDQMTDRDLGFVIVHALAHL